MHVPRKMHLVVSWIRLAFRKLHTVVHVRMVVNFIRLLTIY